MNIVMGVLVVVGFIVALLVITPWLSFAVEIMPWWMNLARYWKWCLDTQEAIKGRLTAEREAKRHAKHDCIERGCNSHGG